MAGFCRDSHIRISNQTRKWVDYTHLLTGSVLLDIDVLVGVLLVGVLLVGVLLAGVLLVVHQGLLQSILNIDIYFILVMYVLQYGTA